MGVSINTNKRLGVQSGLRIIPPSASVEITHEVSSSYAQTASMASNNFIVQGHITASSDISASGVITAKEYILPFNKLFKAIDSTGAEQTIINNFANGYISFGDDDATTIIEGNLCSISTPSITTLGHISASGNISASGQLIGIIDGGNF